MILNEYRIMPWQKEGQGAHPDTPRAVLLRRRRPSLPPGYVPEGK
ncbi:MAG: hypothetical protein R2712_02030 [Vicinamibacterales bacterium]